MVSRACRLHAYEYRRKFDSELALIRRLKELQLRAVALLGTFLFSVLVGICNFLSQIAYTAYLGTPDQTTG